MLNSLTIQNIVLIDKTELRFAPGFCVLSGETGSGKSILLDALGLAIGFRSNYRLIGGDEDKAFVAAEFDIASNLPCREILRENDLLDPDAPNQLRIRRSIHEKQGNKVFINDNPIGVTLLGKIGETLVEIHGQHDQRGLLNSSFHCLILDDFAKNSDLLKSLNKTYLELKETDNKIEELKAKKEQAEREKDYLTHILREINDANIKENEEEELITKKNNLNAREKIINFLSDLKSNLTEGSSQIVSSQNILIRNQNLIDNFLEERSEKFAKISEKLDEVSTIIDDAIDENDNALEEIMSGEESLEEIEARLFLIRNLSRKLKVPAAELSQVAQDAEDKLSLIANEENLTTELEKKHTELFQKYQKIAKDLSEKRQKQAKILAKKVEDELKFLKMENTKFLIEVTQPDNDNYSQNGFDKVRFLASMNNNNFDNISKIASGGELSRFMLALKVALMEVYSVPTIIFDEIDTGIGGGTADAVGKRLKSLSQNVQIFVVTHQPQIASKANLHFLISKDSKAQKVTTSIEKLDQENRKKEIARMLSGELISNEAEAAAEKLIQES